jgi:5-formyltetrahydrofolate cyclo-ligase
LVSPKAEARAVLRAARAALSSSQRETESLAAVRALLASDLLNGAASVALFAALEEEADPSGLERALKKRGVKIAYPRVAGSGRLTFHFARGDQLSPVPPWSIREPGPAMPLASAIDVYVVPGLGFTRQGDRLGYGRGFYDRILAARGPSIAVGFAFSCQLVEQLPVESHDQKLDAVVTGRELIVIER